MDRPIVEHLLKLSVGWLVITGKFPPSTSTPLFSSNQLEPSSSSPHSGNITSFNDIPAAIVREFTLLHLSTVLQGLAVINSAYEVFMVSPSIEIVIT
jgi:hypothetical protein